MAAIRSLDYVSKIRSRLLKLSEAARSLLISRSLCESSSILSSKIDINGVSLHYEVLTTLCFFDYFQVSCHGTIMTFFD